MIKGAPEVVLSRCSHALIDGNLIEINDEFRQRAQDAWEYFGNEGRRVIAFAHRHFREKAHTKFSQSSSNYPENDLVFLGMSAILDPPR